MYMLNIWVQLNLSDRCFIDNSRNIAEACRFRLKTIIGIESALEVA